MGGNGKGNCPVCGSRELLRAGGVMRSHGQMRVRPGLTPGTAVEYRSKVPCGGAGELPESTEDLVVVSGA